MESDAVQNQRVIQVTRSLAERSLSEVLRSVLRMLLQERKEEEEGEGSYYSRGIRHWQPCDVAPLTRSSVGREAPAPKWIEEQLVEAGRRANNRSELLSRAESKSKCIVRIRRQLLCNDQNNPHGTTGRKYPTLHTGDRFLTPIAHALKNVK